MFSWPKAALYKASRVQHAIIRRSYAVEAARNGSLLTGEFACGFRVLRRNSVDYIHQDFSKKIVVQVILF